MNTDDAAALELFVKDHDTRFVPTAKDGEKGAYVLLKTPGSGEEMEIHSVEEYREKYIDTKPGPTIEEAWGKWMEGRRR